MSIRYGQKVSPLGSRKSGFFKKNRYDGSFIKKPKASVWTRPADWLTMPTITSSEQKIALLMPVYPQGSNFLAFSANGNYTVDWGDGNIENVGSSQKAQHAYNYDDPDLNATVTSDGYKMAIVIITPQTGQNLAGVTFSQIYTSPGSTFSNNSPILEIIFSCPNLTANNIALDFCKNLVHFSGVNMGGLTSFANLFFGLTALKQVSNLYTTATVTNTSSMFNNCNSLLSVPLFNTASVTNMSSMFQSCGSMSTIPLFDTAKVTDMSNMFLGCAALVSVPLFDTAKVTIMSGMFINCVALINVPLFNTALVTTMHQMFQACTALIAVPLFNTSNVTLMYNMFLGCSVLTNIPFFNTVKVIRMDNMFSGCRSITSVPLFNTVSVTNMASMFNTCSLLVSVPQFNTTSVTTMATMFQGCSLLTTVPLFDTSKVTTMANMFNSCPSLISVPSFTTTSVTDMSNMFINCYSLTTVPSFTTTSVTNMSGMFQNCLALVTVPPLVSSAVITGNFLNIFANCPSLTRGALSGTRFTVSYSGCKLSKEELESIFTNLGTIGAAGQSLNITNNWGAPNSLSRSATTTANNTTILMPITGGLEIGMQVLGTPSPLTTARTVEFAAGNLVNCTNHGLSNGDEVAFATIATTTGIVINRIYYVVNSDSGTFQVAASVGGVALTLTGTGPGSMRHRTEIVSIVPNTSIVVSRPMSTSGTFTLVFRPLKTGTALMKGWSVGG